MAWKFDKSRATFRELTNAEQAKWDCFQNGVNAGNHPLTAAVECGGMNYKLLQGTHNQYEIRLSLGTRATFLVIDKTETVEVLQVGGHT